jgi:hypothetical protein
MHLCSWPNPASALTVIGVENLTPHSPIQVSATAAAPALDPSTSEFDHSDASTGRTPLLDAPWLHDPSAWSIRRAEASTLRPGVFCFAPSRQTFLRVVAVTHLRGPDAPIFVDLSDGRSLKLAPADEVFIRTAGDPQ